MNKLFLAMLFISSSSSLVRSLVRNHHLRGASTSCAALLSCRININEGYITSSSTRRSLASTSSASGKIDSTPSLDLGSIDGDPGLAMAMDRDSFLFGPLDTRKTFRDCGIHEDLCAALENCGKPTATLIQAKSIETILSGKDVVIGAETGSGKTFSYLLPMIDACIKNKESRNSPHYPPVIIMVPNKELVMQVESVAEEIISALDKTGDHGITTEGMTSASDWWPFSTSTCPEILICTPAFLSRFLRGPHILNEGECFKMLMLMLMLMFTQRLLLLICGHDTIQLLICTLAYSY